MTDQEIIEINKRWVARTVGQMKEALTGLPDAAFVRAYEEMPQLAGYPGMPTRVLVVESADNLCDIRSIETS